MPQLDTPEIQVEITVRISQPHYAGGQIALNQTLYLPSTDFLGFAGIMKRFHDLAQEIKAAAPPPPGAKR